MKGENNMEEQNRKTAVVDDYETFSDDIRSLRQQRMEAMKGREDAIVLFEHDDCWFAFEDDADRIFEKIGWQTSAKLMDEGAISWMDIGYAGRKELDASGEKVVYLKPNIGINVVPCSSEQDYMDERLSRAQQVIDYLRHHNPNEDAILNVGMFPVHLHDEGIDSYTSVYFVRFMGQDVSLFTDNGHNLLLVNGPHWNVYGRRDFIIGAGDLLDFRLMEAMQMLNKYSADEMQRQLRTEDVLEEYNRITSHYRYDHVVMEQDGFYEAFSDDAVSLAKKYQLPLWDRNAGNGQVVPTVLLDIEQIDRVLSVADDVLIEESNIQELRNELVLKPSPLNDGLRSELNFNESGIKKTRNGDFMVWARMNGVDLPDKEISRDMGIRYSRLTNGAEKEMVLRTMLQQSYGSMLEELAERSQTNTMRMRPTG